MKNIATIIVNNELIRYFLFPPRLKPKNIVTTESQAKKKQIKFIDFFFVILRHKLNKK